jgi:histone deacetylase 1/2
MEIKHIGHSILHTPHSSFSLNNILHVPSASKNLLSVHKITRENNVFIEFRPFIFLNQEPNNTKNSVSGPCYGGLYPLVPISNESSKHAFITIKSSSSTWNCCLGNPSSFVAQQVLIKNKIAYFPEITPYVCDSYQLAKSNQLPYVPYHISTSVSTSPLEQVFNKCMGSCPS